MEDELKEQLARSEVLGEQGDVDGSQAAASLAEAIKARSWAFHLHLFSHMILSGQRPP